MLLHKSLFIAVTLATAQAAAQSTAPAKASSTVEITFESIKGLLLHRSERIQSSRLEVEAAQEREDFLERSFLPTVEAHASSDTFRTSQTDIKTQPSFGVEGRINLFNGGRDSLESKSRTLRTGAATARLQRQMSEELQKARILFWEIMYRQGSITTIEAAIKLNSSNLQSAERRIRSGVATESDRVEFEMKAVELKRDLATAMLEFVTQQRQLKVLLGLDKLTEIQLPKDVEHEHRIEKFLEHSEADHEFLYRETEAMANVAHIQAKIQNRTWWPSVDAYVSHSQFNERIASGGIEPSSPLRTETAVGLRATISLSKGFESVRETAALAKEANALRKLAGFQRRQTETHIENEFAELNQLHELIHAAEENIVRAEKYHKLTLSEYARGVKNSPDVLGAAEKLFVSRLKLLEISRDFNIAKSHVLSKIGR